MPPRGERRSSSDERLVARTLQAGLAVGLALMLAGVVIAVATGAVEAEPVRLRELTAPLPLGTRLAGLGVLALGLTPGMRVLLLVVLWARERDWRFAAVAATVLAVLTASLLAGVG